MNRPAGETVPRVVDQLTVSLAVNCTACPTTTVAADGTGITEPVGNGYTRLAVAMNATTWTVTANAITNAIALTTATASGNWGVLTDAFLYSTASGAGTLYVFDVLAVARTITSGEALTCAAGDFDWTI